VDPGVTGRNPPTSDARSATLSCSSGRAT